MKKYILLTYLCSFGSSALCEQPDQTTNNTEPQEQQVKTVHITQCATLQFAVDLDWKDATVEERTVALNKISSFLNSDAWNQLKNDLEKDAPHTKISINLVNVTEDAQAGETPVTPS